MSDTNVLNMSVYDEMDQNSKNTIDFKKAANMIEKVVDDNLSKYQFIQIKRRREKEKKKHPSSTKPHRKSQPFIKVQVTLASFYMKIFNKNKT